LIERNVFVSSRISEKFLRHFAKVYDDDAERITWFYLVGSIPETPFARVSRDLRYGPQTVQLLTRYNCGYSSSWNF
jgi:hypothetical protein